MDRFLNNLFSSRGSEREHALSSIINDLTGNYRSAFVEKNFATLLHRCLSSFQKKSSKEIALAARVLGLLAVTLGCGDNSQELYKEALPHITKALMSKNETVLRSVIDCLGIITFVGANGFDQTEASMEILWNFVNPNQCENAAGNKHSASVLFTAISTWSLLLTSFDGWGIYYKFRKSALSYHLDLLESEDESVSMAASEALALICEIDGDNINYEGLSVQELRETVSSRAEQLLIKTACQSEAMRACNQWNNFSKSILEILEVDGCFHESVLKIGRHELKLRTLSQLLQIDYMKRFLGRGFVPHMVLNDFLLDVFNFTPLKKTLLDAVDNVEREEVVVQVYVKRPNTDYEGSGSDSERNPAVDKGRTRLLNKQRDLKGKESQA